MLWGRAAPISAMREALKSRRPSLERPSLLRLHLATAFPFVQVFQDLQQVFLQPWHRQHGEAIFRIFDTMQGRFSRTAPCTNHSGAMRARVAMCRDAARLWLKSAPNELQHLVGAAG